MKHLIVGAGPAGVIAAETLRRVDPGSEIVLIGDEPEPPYSRMALPYYLTNRIDEEGTYLRKNRQHFEDRRIEVERDRITGVDAGNKVVKLEKGGQRGFDRLLIATGSHPIRPPIPGMDSPGVHSCWTLEDARNIAARAVKGSEVVLMGAGFIGCIILEALALRGVKLTVIEMGDRMVPRMMDQTAGNLIKKWCQAKGVGVHTSTKVESIEPARKGRLKVKLDNGSMLDADLVIAATGVRSNTDFLKDSGVKTEVGVLVDDRLQTSNPRIYAAGDVASPFKFTHTANALGRMAMVNALFWGRQRASRLVVPWCTYTEPELAHVGLSERQAREQGLEVATLTVPFTENDRAVLDEEDGGFIRVHLKRGTDRLLGATIVAAHAGDLLTYFTLAMASGRGLGSLAQAIYPYPTQGELIKKVANLHLQTKLTPTVKRLLGAVLAWRR